MAAWTATTLLLLCPLVHASLPWTPCSYAILRDRGLPETFNTVPSPHEMYAAQAKCDAMGPSCGGFSMIGATSYFKKPFTVSQPMQYTLRDLARLDSYATDRGVLVIPEFDSPGHGGAWCQGYPSLCPSANCTLPMDPSNNLTYSVIQNLVVEMRETFSSGIYHGGGDEVDYSCWESTPRIKAWMTKNGLTGEGAYSYFLHQVAGMASPGAPMFWQDAAEKEMPATPLPKDSTIEYYKAGPIAATSQKYRVVYADNGKWGLDIHTSEKMWEAFYTVDPTVEIGHGLNEANLLGGESAVWTVTTDASILSPVLWPRLLAVGEKLWSPMADTATVTTSNAAARMAWARCELNRRGIPAASSLSSLTPAEVGLYGSCLLQ